MAVQDLTPQLRTRLGRVERVVGVFVSVATLLLLAGFAYYLYHTGLRKGWWSFKARYHTFTESAAGLGVGGEVKLLGFSVGRITEVTALSPEQIIYGDYGNVYIEFYVLDPYHGYIWNDSKVKVVSGDFLGGRFIEVIAGGSSGSTNLVPTYKTVSGQWRALDDKSGEYKDNPKGYTLLAMESPAVTERLEQVANQVQAALPGILDLTNRVNLVLSNVANLTLEAQGLLANAQPMMSNITTITANLRDPKGSLGEWVLPLNLHTQLLQTLSSANATLTNATRMIASTDTNVTTLATNLDLTLINLANLTSNLNQQVQNNTNLVKSISDMITNADDMVQGLKRHWLLRGAFKKKEDQPEQSDSSEGQKAPKLKSGKWRN